MLYVTIGVIFLLIISIIILVKYTNNIKKNKNFLEREVNHLNESLESVRNNYSKSLKEINDLRLKNTTLEHSYAGLKLSHKNTLDNYTKLSNKEKSFEVVSSDLLQGDLWFKNPKNNVHISNATVYVKIKNDEIVDSYILRKNKRVQVLIYSRQ